MSDRLIRDLRVPKMNSFSTMVEAADEIERLRALITAWADADEAWRLAGRYSDDHAIYESKRNALRKAVGR